MEFLKKVHPLTWVLLVLVAAIAVIVLLDLKEGAPTWQTIVESSAAIIFGLTCATLHEMYKRKQHRATPRAAPHEAHLVGIETKHPNPNIKPEDDDNGGLYLNGVKPIHKVAPVVAPISVSTVKNAFSDIPEVASPSAN